MVIQVAVIVWMLERVGCGCDGGSGRDVSRSLRVGAVEEGCMCFDVLSCAFILLPPVHMFMFMFKLMLMDVNVVVVVLPARAMLNVTVGGCDTAHARIIARGRSGCGKSQSQVLKICQVLQASEPLHPGPLSRRCTLA